MKLDALIETYHAAYAALQQPIPKTISAKASDRVVDRLCKAEQDAIRAIANFRCVTAGDVCKKLSVLFEDVDHYDSFDSQAVDMLVTGLKADLARLAADEQRHRKAA